MRSHHANRDQRFQGRPEVLGGTRGASGRSGTRRLAARQGVERGDRRSGWPRLPGASRVVGDGRSGRRSSVATNAAHQASARYAGASELSGSALEGAPSVALLGEVDVSQARADEGVDFPGAHRPRWRGCLPGFQCDRISRPAHPGRLEFGLLRFFRAATVFLSSPSRAAKASSGMPGGEQRGRGAQQGVADLDVGVEEAEGAVRRAPSSQRLTLASSAAMGLRSTP